MITVPLVGGIGNTDYDFDQQLGDNLLSFNVVYVTVAGPAWSMNVDREGVRLISGAMLEPGAELTRDYSLDIGKLVFTGDEPTLDNLGKANSLVWVPDE